MIPPNDSGEAIDDLRINNPGPKLDLLDEICENGKTMRSIHQKFFQFLIKIAVLDNFLST